MEILLIIGYSVLCLAWFWLYLIKFKYNYSINIIEILVDYYSKFSNYDKIVLISKLINEVDFKELDPIQKQLFKEKIGQIK